MADWTDDELDLIVADYFSMLDDELAGRPFVKLHHNKALSARVGRSHGSIEYKHRNISAVLTRIGITPIEGYLPADNFQGAIYDAIYRYLDQRPGLLWRVPEVVPAAAPDVFVPPPGLVADAERVPAGMARIVRKFDPVKRDQENRKLGKAGEEFVLEVERRKLHDLERADLCRKMRWVAEEDGDGAGYDILSFEPSGQERLIEVKTTNGTARTPFFLSRNEHDVARQRPDDWRIYRVHAFSKDPRIFVLQPPLDQCLNLRTETWRAAFT